MARRALIVGINHYDSLPGAELQGAIPDAQRVAEMLSRHNNGDPNYDCHLLVSSQSDPITRARLREELEQLFRGTNDEVLFYFSGHGTVTSTGGHIVTQDGVPNDWGISMDELVTLANDRHESETIIIVDSCMSGAMGNVQALQGDGPYQRSLLGQNVSILAASRHNESSIEEAGEGLFTNLLLDALDGTAANILGNITLPAIYAHIEGSLGPWDQRPVFKTYTSKVTIVRKADPPIPLPTLRQLTTLFETPDTRYQLSPNYEYDRVAETEEQKIGKLFKKLRDVGLVCAQDPEKDFFWVALDSDYLVLTQLGRHFWSLITDRRI